MNANSANSATWQPPFARILGGKGGTGFVQYGIADRSVVSVSIADVPFVFIVGYCPNKTASPCRI